MERLTGEIIRRLEEGVLPWQQPWTGGGTPGRNIITDREYRGLNWFLTLLAGRPSRYWLTFRQARSLGGSVRKGENGTAICYFALQDRVGSEGTVDRVPFVRYYTVFNLDQCDIPEASLPGHVIRDRRVAGYELSEDERIQRCDRLFEDWEAKPTLVHGEQRAWYAPATDTINMPTFGSFERAEDYYATLYHEMTHATGASHRLDRPAVAKLVTYQFGSREYGREELVAEMGAARLCYETGIGNRIIDQSAAYINGWLTAIRETPSMVFRAARAADRAACSILGGNWDDDG